MLLICFLSAVDKTATWFSLICYTRFVLLICRSNTHQCLIFMHPFLLSFTGSHPGEFCVSSAASHHVWSVRFARQTSRWVSEDGYLLWWCGVGFWALLQMEIHRNWTVRRVSTTVAQMNWARFLKDDPCPDCHSSHTDDTSHIVKTDQFPMNLYICSPRYTHDRKRRKVFLLYMMQSLLCYRFSLFYPVLWHWHFTLLLVC